MFVSAPSLESRAMPFGQSRARLNWVALLCSIVMMLTALAPTVSRALAANGQISWMEICSGDGVQWVLADDASADPSSPSDSGSIDHCPLCVLVADKLAPALTAAPAVVAMLRAVLRLPLPPEARPVEAVSAFAAPPRGPPSLSAPI